MGLLGMFLALGAGLGVAALAFARMLPPGARLAFVLAQIAMLSGAWLGMAAGAMAPRLVLVEAVLAFAFLLGALALWTRRPRLLSLMLIAHTPLAAVHFASGAPGTPAFMEALIGLYALVAGLGQLILFAPKGAKPR